MLVETYHSTPIGNLKIVHDEHYLMECHFIDEVINASNRFSAPRDCLPGSATGDSQQRLSLEIETQLANYFEDPFFRFTLPYKLQGSLFQKKVWNALRCIPSGQVKTYGDIALQLNTSPRAIGQACKSNPLPIFIPCHRVVGQNSMGGYMGNKTKAIAIKEALLRYENAKA